MGTLFSPSAVCAHGRRMDTPCEICRVTIALNPMPVVHLSVEEINLNAGAVWNFNPATARKETPPWESGFADKFYGAGINDMAEALREELRSNQQFHSTARSEERPAFRCTCGCVFAIKTPLATRIFCPSCGEPYDLQDESTALPKGRS